MRELTGGGAMIRFILRREKVALPLWILLLVVMVLGTPFNYAHLLSTDEMIRSIAEEIGKNEMLSAFAGRLNEVSLAGLSVWKIGDTCYTLIGLMSILTVTRHTRAEEESGRRELLGACAIGRLASLTASLAVACGASVLAGALAALGWIVYGFEPAGSIAFGFALAVPGCFYAALAALTAQLTVSARRANMLALTGLVAGYVLRFAGDASGYLWMKWVSVQGLSHLVAPFGSERWLVPLLPLAAAIVLAAVAFRLAASRDLGSGLIQPKPGPSAAPRLGKLALAWRMQRGLLAGWTIGFALTGVLLGGIIGGLSDSGNMRDWGTKLLERYMGSAGATFEDIFLSVIVQSLSYSAMLYPMFAVLRLRDEEAEGRAEALLAAPFGRLQWAMSHLVFAFAGTAVIMTAAGAAIGLAYGMNAGGLSELLPRLLAASWVELPAIWIMGGIAVLVVGIVPRMAAAVCWAAFLFFNLFGEVLGPIFGLDQSTADKLVPFHHVPKLLTGGAFALSPVLLLAAVCALLVVCGLAGLRRRDIG